VLILQVDEVACFHTDLEVLILEGVSGAAWPRKDEYRIGLG
jgi:hypothetical protein